MEFEHPEKKLIENLAIHRYFGIQNLVIAKGKASFELVVTQKTVNIFNKLHGGVFYGLCDLVAYMAILLELDSGLTAVTQDIHVSVMRPAKIGDLIIFTGKLIQMGKRIVFCQGEAFIKEKLAATAQVTKSILSIEHE